MVAEYVSLKWFLISFSLGLMVVLLFVPPPSVVVKFPNPETAGQMMYKDSAGACFKYKAVPVDCTPGAKQQPISEDFTWYAPHAIPDSKK
jgi:hypothetical protein